MKTLFILTTFLLLSLTSPIGYIGQEPFFDIIQSENRYTLIFLKPIPDSVAVQYNHNSIPSAINEANRVYYLVKK